MMRTTVQQRMMKGPDHAVISLAETKDRESHQGSRGKIESAKSVRLQVTIDFVTLLVFYYRPQIKVGQTHDNMRVHFLERLIEAQFETRSQDVVTLDSLLPGALQTNEVYFLAQPADHLLHVTARPWIVDAMEEHSVLHRRQRIDC